MKKTVKIGLSPCPNDTFIFHALLAGLIRLDNDEGIRLEPFMADVEKLNAMAIAGELPVTKISIGVVPHIMDRFSLLDSGAALGWGCGPLVVAKRPLAKDELAAASVAIPGRRTTANLLLDLHGGFAGPRREMLFSDIIPAVAAGEVELGVIIHEGRFTYKQHGLHKILDMGEWWEESFHMPLPLGAIAARRDLPESVALAIQKGIAQSVAFAWQNPDAAKEFVSANARELSEEVTRAHIKTFVTNYSQSLGPGGRQAICQLVGSALGNNEDGLDKRVFLSWQ